MESAPNIRSAPADPLTDPVSFRVRVPATAANLGPGYDCLGLAFDLCDVVDVEAAPRAEDARPRVEVEVRGEAAETLPTDERHLIVALISRFLAEHGYRLPDLRLLAQNRIPHSRGLGSSAAAVACAVVAAAELLPDGLTEDEQLQLGSQIEGHPDNYVPALCGGAAVSWSETGPGGLHFDTAALRLDPRIRATVAVPAFQQSTAQARSALPETVPHAVAAANSARTGLLVHALTADPQRLLPATVDALHQQARRHRFPESMMLVDAMRRAGHAAVISGAGPTVLVLSDGDQAAEAAFDDFERHAGLAEGGWRPMRLPISTTGATVERYPR